MGDLHGNPADGAADASDDGRAQAEPSVAELTDRIFELEAANARLLTRLETAARPHRGRTFLAVVLIVLGTLLSPVAIVAAWGRAVLTDTDAFVATYAPLIRDPSVQAWISEEVAGAVEARVDVDALVGQAAEALAGLTDRPAARTAIKALVPPATDGVRGAISSGSARVIASPEFAQVWTQGLRAAHQAATKALENDPDALLVITDAGLTLQLKPLVEHVQAALGADGFELASRVPVADKSIVIAPDVSLRQVQLAYGVVLAAGYWLSPVVLLLMASGVLSAVRRARATIWAAAGLSLGACLVLFAAGIGLAVLQSQVPVPAQVLARLYGATTATLTDLAAATLLVAVAVGAAAWLSGPFASAVRLRAGFTRAAQMLRERGDAAGVSTGRFGRWLFAHRVALRVAVVLTAAVVLAMSRPLAIGPVLGTALSAAVVLMLLELLGRPTSAVAASST